MTENVVDLRPSSGGSAQAIETVASNTGVQTGYLEGYTEVLWSNGFPSLIEKWEDSSKTTKLWTITPTFTNGQPTQIVKVNEVKNTTETTTLVWSGVELINVEKV